MVSVLAIGPKVRGFNSGRGRWITKGDKSRSTLSSGDQVKPSVPCRKFLRHVKKPFEVWRKILRNIKFIISFASSSCLLDASACKIWRELRWTTQEFSPVDIIPTCFFMFMYHLGVCSTPVGGRSAETWSHPITWLWSFYLTTLSELWRLWM
jgi:hypothetical protein